MPGGTRRVPCNAVFRIRDRHLRTIIPDNALLFRCHPGRRAQRRAGIQTSSPAAPLDPRFALRAPRDDSKKQNVLPDAPSFDVIPDGPQGRVGIQSGASRKPLDPRFALRAPEDDSRK